MDKKRFDTLQCLKSGNLGGRAVAGFWSLADFGYFSQADPSLSDSRQEGLSGVWAEAAAHDIWDLDLLLFNFIITRERPFICHGRYISLGDSWKIRAGDISRRHVTGGTVPPSAGEGNKLSIIHQVTECQ